MSERRIGQLSFADNLVADASQGNATLTRIAELVDWKEIEKVLAGLRSGVMGAPAYPALALFKALLLQQFYGLSDPQLEEALADRLSFRHFLGLSLTDRVPDHSTIWRFREQLAKSGLAERTFALITGQIERSGFVLKRGTLIDASLVRGGRQCAGAAHHPTAAGCGRAAGKQAGEEPARSRRGLDEEGGQVLLRLQGACCHGPRQPDRAASDVYRCQRQ